MSAKKVKIYAAGGCAINIMRAFEKAAGLNRHNPGFATVDVSYIDSSKSNLRDVPTPDNYYHLSLPDGELTDGGGKVRGVVYQPAVNAMPDILTKHKPGDLNIVLHSAGGGSGGTLGGVITKGLLDRGESVIVIIVGSSTCEKEVENSMKTIESYRNLANAGRPIIAIWHDNANGGMRSIDTLVHLDILTLSAVWSGENHGLDSQDLIHFLDYQKVTSYKPNFAGLVITSSGQALDLRPGQAVSSLVSMVRPDDDPDPQMTVGYYSFGTLSQAASDAIKYPTPIHLHTVQGLFTGIYNDFKAQLEDMQNHASIHVVNDLAVSGNTADGHMVL